MSDQTTSGLFIEDGSALRALPRAEVQLEADLQELVAQYPELLNGDDDFMSGQRWLLIRREQGIAAGEAEGDRFSVDHLFVDQDGIPTLVEVKRASDTRIRRKVVAQMLDYAANAQSFLAPKALRASFEGEHPDSSELIKERLGREIKPDGLWAAFESNLTAGNLRMVFLADQIPTELLTLIEFLNEQFSSIDVYGIEVVTFQSDDQRVIRTRKVGQTQTARARKQTRTTREWDRESWLADLSERSSPEAVAVAERIFEYADRNGLTEFYGKGAITASVQVGLDNEEAYCFPFLIYNSGGVEVAFHWMIGKTKPFDRREKRLEFRDHVEAIPGVEIPEEMVDKRPGFPLELLASEDAFAAFISAFEWALEQAREAGRAV